MQLHDITIERMKGFDGYFYVNEFGELMFHINPKCPAYKRYPSPFPVAPYSLTVVPIINAFGKTEFLIGTTKDNRKLVVPELKLQFFKNQECYGGFGYYKDYPYIANMMFNSYLHCLKKLLKEDKYYEVQ